MLHLKKSHGGPVWLQHCMIWMLLCPIALLFTPAKYLPETSTLWIANHATYLYVGILTSVSYFLTIFCLFLFELGWQHYTLKKRKRHIADMLAQLDFNERAILREFWLQRKSVITLPISEPSVKRLLDAGILEPAHPAPDFYVKTHTKDKQVRPLIISLHARPLISFKVIGLNPTTMTAEQIEWLKNARPRFIYRGFR